MDWLVFSFDILAQLLALYGLGFFVLRIAKMNIERSFVFAPLVSVPVIAILTIAIAALGIAASWWSLVLVPVCVALFIFLIVWKARGSRHVIYVGKHAAAPSYDDARKTPWWQCPQFLIALYIAVAAGACIWMYFSLVPSLDSFVQLFDNAGHLIGAKALSQHSSWSLLDGTTYSFFATGENPLAENQAAFSFYPPVWRWLVALPMTVIEQNAAISSNAALVSVTIVLLPVSSYALLRTICGKHKTMVLCGAVMPCAFIALPYSIITWGPLYANLVGFALIPAEIALFWRCLFEKSASIGTFIRKWLLLLLGLCAIGIAHPNTLFTLGVLIAPLLVWAISRIPFAWKSRERWLHVVWRLVFGTAAVVCIVAVWVLTFHTPQMKGVVDYPFWTSVSTFSHAFRCILLCDLDPARSFAPQLVLAAVVAIGFVGACCIKRFRWIAASYVVSAWCFIVSISQTFEGWQIFTGFWYNDKYRLACMVALAGIPLAALGLSLVCRAVCWIFRRLFHAGSRALVPTVCLIFMAAFAVCNYAPFPADSKWYTPRDFTVGAFADGSSWVVYTPQKQRFLAAASQIVGDSGYIINNPFDGSVFSYPTDGVPILFRELRFNPERDGTPLTYRIKDHLSEGTSSSQLMEALDEVNAHYVVFLSRKPHFANPDPAQWESFEAFGENTPGAALVLKDGDLELWHLG